MIHIDSCESLYDSFKSDVFASFQKHQITLTETQKIHQLEVSKHTCTEVTYFQPDKTYIFFVCVCNAAISHCVLGTVLSRLSSFRSGGSWSGWKSGLEDRGEEQCGCWRAIPVLSCSSLPNYSSQKKGEQGKRTCNAIAISNHSCYSGK